MYKLSFTLKQHTPIIHFQHDQDGATLRATEVKPKLDRFIIEKLTGLKGDAALMKFKENKEWKSWLIGNGECKALDYKLFFNSVGKNIQSSILESLGNKFKSKTYPMLLSNMGGAKNKEELRDLVHFESIECKILSNDNLLTAKICEMFIKFFALTNFGNRSTKGFGSYTVTEYQVNDDPKVPVIWNEKNVLPLGTFYLKISSKNTIDVFKIIDYYWKRLKSGINYSKYDKDKGTCSSTAKPELYQKSFLYKYLENNKSIDFIWEKRKIKRNFFNNKIPISVKEERFARALLGLSDKFSYARTFENCNPEKIRTKIQTKIEIETEHLENDDSKKIERIPSPIIMKPIEVDDCFFVYILFDNNYDSYPLLEIEFKLSLMDFSLIYGKDERGKDKKLKIKAKTPLNDITNYTIEAINFAKTNGLRDPMPDLNYFLSLPESTLIKTPKKKIDLNDLISEYNNSELKSRFIPIGFDGNPICSIVTISRII